MKKTLVLLAILMLAFWTTSHALIGFGVRAGMGSYGNGSSKSGLLLGAHVDFTALPMIGLEASATYWPKKEESTSGSYKTTLNYSVISLDGTAKYKISLPGSPLVPYIGAGPGLYMTKVKSETSPAPPPPAVASWDTSQTKFGIHGALGANFKPPMMSISFGAQAKYSYIFSDPKSHMLSIVGLVTYNF